MAANLQLFEAFDNKFEEKKKEKKIENYFFLKIFIFCGRRQMRLLRMRELRKYCLRHWLLVIQDSTVGATNNRAKGFDSIMLESAVMY